MHDEVHEPVLLQEFAALEPVGQLDLDRVPDRARACEADQRLRLGEDKVAERREAGGDAAGRRVGKQADENLPCLVEAGEGGAGLGHLHERER